MSRTKTMKRCTPLRPKTNPEKNQFRTKNPKMGFQRLLSHAGKNFLESQRLPCRPASRSGFCLSSETLPLVESEKDANAACFACLTPALIETLAVQCNPFVHGCQ